MTEKDYQNDIHDVRNDIASIQSNMSHLVASEAARSASCNAHFLRTAIVEDVLFGNAGLKDRMKVLETVAKTKTQLVATLIAAVAAVAAAAGVIVMIVQRTGI